MANILNPVDNRADFEKILISTFNWTNFYSAETALEACLDDNTGEKLVIQGVRDDCVIKINGYLSAWDAALDQQGRAAVVGSVEETLI